MANLPLEDFLTILLLIWDFMKTHGFSVSFGGQTYTLSFSVMILGLAVVSIVVTIIQAIWWGE